MKPVRRSSRAVQGWWRARRQLYLSNDLAARPVLPAGPSVLFRSIRLGVYLLPSSSFFYLLRLRLTRARGYARSEARWTGKQKPPTDHSCRAAMPAASMKAMRRRAKSFTASPPHGELPAATGSGARPRRSARRGRTSARRRQRAAGSSRTSPALRCGTC